MLMTELYTQPLGGGIRFSYLENAFLEASKGRNREKYMFSH